jgi:hypothetical protein
MTAGSTCNHADADYTHFEYKNRLDACRWFFMD